MINNQKIKLDLIKHELELALYPDLDNAFKFNNININLNDKTKFKIPAGWADKTKPKRSFIILETES